jgi:hypothetical protein
MQQKGQNIMQRRGKKGVWDVAKREPLVIWTDSVWQQ